MDFIKGYDLDSLSYIDEEYDNPVVKEAVHALITTEMRTFNPSKSKYLAHLPYPELKFANSTALQLEFSRVSSGQAAEKIDLKRYAVDKPEAALEKDVQAWRRSVSNAKSQLEHQGNRLMNLELAEKFMPEVCLHNNRAVERIGESIASKLEFVEKQVQLVNSDRKRTQELARYELNKLLQRRDEAICKIWQISTHCSNMEESLPMEALEMLQQESLLEMTTEASGSMWEAPLKRLRVQDGVE